MVVATETEEKAFVCLVGDLSNDYEDGYMMDLFSLLSRSFASEDVLLHTIGVSKIGIDLALCLMQHNEKVDLKVVKLATIFHDVMLYKVDFKDHAYESARKFIDFLNQGKIKVGNEQKDNIVHCILSHAARQEGRIEEPKSLEAKIIFDANILQQLEDSGIAYFIKNSKGKDVAKIARDLLNDFERRVFALLTPYGRFMGEMRMETIRQFVNNILNGR